MHRTSVVATLVLFAARAGSCQIPPVAPESGFEVASIKPSDPAATGSQIDVSPGGVFTAKNTTLKALVQLAYELRDSELTGGPGWLETQRYDIVAKGNVAGVSDDEMRKMTDRQRDAVKARFLLQVQKLLAGRFQLKTHRETKELPVYALSIARNGTKIKTVADDDATHSSLRMTRGSGGNAEITGTGVPLAYLARTLSDLVGRSVMDKTGLKGNYDFKVTFTPDTGLRAAAGDGPSIFTALQEQLGLRLDSEKEAVEVLVVDSAQKASEN